MELQALELALLDDVEFLSGVAFLDDDLVLLSGDRLQSVDELELLELVELVEQLDALEESVLCVSLRHAVLDDHRLEDLAVKREHRAVGHSRDRGRSLVVVKQSKLSETLAGIQDLGEVDLVLDLGVVGVSAALVDGDLYIAL